MNEKRSVKTAVISFFLFSLLFLLHYSDVISIRIKTATPIILLPLLCAFSMFSTPAVSAATGLVLGICMDSAASGTLCFNAVLNAFRSVYFSVFLPPFQPQSPLCGAAVVFADPYLFYSALAYFLCVYRRRAG